MRWAMVLVLFASCSATQPSSQVQQALDLARGLGDAVLRVKGFNELARSVPDLLPLLDANGDRILTLAEVESFLQSAMANPQNVGLLIGTLLLLRN